jgi:hypothetical protein
MPRTLESALAIAVILIFSSTAQAQQRNSTVGPSVNRDTTTGIGSSSGFRNVPPPGQPLVGQSFPYYFFTPPTNEVPEEEPKPKEGAATEGGRLPATQIAPTEPPPEDPRTQITRDRIESPQHR